MAWAIQNSGTAQNLRAVWAVDANTAYAVGDAGTTLRTVNGGANWNAVPHANYTNNMNGVCFASAASGWIAASGGLIMKWDAANAKWILDHIINGALFRGVHALLIGATNHGLVVGDNGTVEALTSGVWSSKNHSGNPMLRGVSIATNVTGFEGWACGNPQNPSTSGQLSYYTGTWQAYTSYPAPFNGVCLVTKDLGWCCGNSGKIYKKLVGTTWNSQSTPPGTGKLNGISMLSDGQQGCCVGDLGTLLWCTGGGTWTSMPYPGGTPYPNLNGVHFRSANLGWAVGNAGTILKYT